MQSALLGVRYVGTVEWLAVVDASDLVKWITGIPFADWPQQHRVDDQLRPAMVSDRAWHGFGERAAGVVNALMTHFPDCSSEQWMVSVVMPGHAIEPHVDQQSPHWRCRVHVPLTTNPQSYFLVSGVNYCMDVGQAYRVNTEAEHAVTNDGNSPRIHFMFDVRANA